MLTRRRQRSLRKNDRPIRHLARRGRSYRLGRDVGVAVSLIDGSAGNFDVLEFSGNYGGLQQLSVYGNQTSGATGKVVTVDAGTIQQVFRDNNIWGGLYAVYTSGIDGLYENNFIAAWGTAGANLFSHGGVNWYLRNKIDTAGGTPAYALAMDRGSLVGTMENHL